MGNDKQYIKNFKKIVNLVTVEAGLSVPDVSEVKEVKITNDRDFLSLDIFIIVRFGVKIPEIAWDVQSAVKNAILKEFPTLNIKSINIHVQGVVR